MYATIVFKPGPFNELLKEEIQGFEGRTEIELRSNRDDVIINLIFFKNKYIRLVKGEKMTKIAKINIEIYLSNVFFIS